MDAHERGQALEELTKYLFRRVPGVRFSDKDVLTARGSEEIDLIFWNDGLREGLPFLPNILLFECKNWRAPVGSHAVAFFIHKIASRHLEYGFLVAANGVTGGHDDLNAARGMIDTAFVQQRIKTMVITRDEIEQLTSTERLVRLIQDKIMALTLRKPQL